MLNGHRYAFTFFVSEERLGKRAGETSEGVCGA